MRPAARVLVLALVVLALVLELDGCGEHEDAARPGSWPHEPNTPHGEAAPRPVDELRSRILAGLALQPGMVVAEIGLGRGWFVFRAAHAVGHGGHVYATDIDPDAITFMRSQLPAIDPASAPVDVRLCSGPRDTALDDLAADSIDVVTMVDSLCFDGPQPHADDVAYLRRFRRLLKPGGRLVHHMDCNCAVSPDTVTALFVEAGFAPDVGTIDTPPPRTPVDPSWRCATAESRARDRFVGVYGKPVH